MSRKLSIEYPGATYCLMNRGDQRGNIFMGDGDRQEFLSKEGGGVGKTQWQGHA